MRLATAEEPSQPSLYMERAPLKKEEMVEEINQVIFEITMLIGIVLCAIS